MNITLHINQPKELGKAVELSKQVFEPSPEKLQKYHDENDWLNKINNGGLLVNAWDSSEMVGFSICYPKEGKLHIWNVGVLEKYRKLGIWKMMYGEIEKFAKEKKFDQLTLNTYKTRFPGMYNFALRNGFTEYKTEAGKSSFIKKI